MYVCILERIGELLLDAPPVAGIWDPTHGVVGEVEPGGFALDFSRLLGNEAVGCAVVVDPEYDVEIFCRQLEFVVIVLHLVPLEVLRGESLCHRTAHRLAELGVAAPHCTVGEGYGNGGDVQHRCTVAADAPCQRGGCLYRHRYATVGRGQFVIFCLDR